MRKKGILTTVLTAIVIAIGVIAILSLHGCGDTIDGTSVRSLPNHFNVKERAFFKWGDTFDVSADGVNYGTVSQKLLSWTKSFNYDNNTGAPSASGNVEAFSWGTKIDVKDGQGQLIGSIKKELFSSFFKAWTVYSILDANGHKVAASQNTEFFSTSFQLTANDGHVIATVSRPAFNWFGDNWEVTIKDSTTVDPRLDVMIAAFKTSADNAKKAEDSKNSDDKKK